MHIYIYTYIHFYISTFLHNIYTYIHIHIYIYTYIHVYIHTRIYIHLKYLTNILDILRSQRTAQRLLIAKVEEIFLVK